MVRVLLLIVAVGLVIFLVRAWRQRPPGKGPDGQLPPPRRQDRHQDSDED